MGGRIHPWATITENFILRIFRPTKAVIIWGIEEPTTKIPAIELIIMVGASNSFKKSGMIA